MQTKAEKATELFSKGYNCAQSVFGAFCEDNGLDLETALKIACGFGGGAIRYNQTCGAISGGVMVIGLKCGHYKTGDNEAKQKCYQKTKEYTDKFKETLGCIKCCELLGMTEPVRIEMENDPVKMKSIYHPQCEKFIKTAIQILETMEY